MRKAQINNSQEKSHQDYGNQYDRRRGDGFFPRGPGNFLQLHPHLAKKLLCPLPKFFDLFHFIILGQNFLWQARRDSNPHHPDLESGALAVRATGLLSPTSFH